MSDVRYSYKIDTGEILSVMSGRLKSVSMNHKGGVVVDYEGPEIDPDKHYHKDGAIADRPAVTLPDVAAIGVPIIVAGIPSGAGVSVDGVEVGVSDGTDIELAFDLDGEYEVEVKPPFPYVSVKTKITVTP